MPVIFRLAPGLVLDDEVVDGAAAVLPGAKVQADGRGRQLHEAMHLGNLRLVALRAGVQDLRRFAGVDPGEAGMTELFYNMQEILGNYKTT